MCGLLLILSCAMCLIIVLCCAEPGVFGFLIFLCCQSGDCKLDDDVNEALLAVELEQKQRAAFEKVRMSFVCFCSCC